APGPYRVGFTVLHRRDASRVWRVEDDAVKPGDDPTRPVRISVWYPAAASGGRPMRYGDYVRVPKVPSDFATFHEMLARRHLRSLSALIDGPAALARLLGGPVGARLDAPAAAGRFPLVTYASGLNESWQHANFVLAELLASHGFVVAAVPQLATT